MNAFNRFLPTFIVAYLCSISTAYAKPIEDIFNEMFALKDTDPGGFWAMVTSIGLLFALAFGLMALTLGYYVRHWFKRK
jgi:hypothetical protein